MYKITVNEVNIVEKTEKEWKRLRDATPGEPDMPEYGYVQTKNMVPEETTVFYQEVSEINLVSIIDAVNKLPVVTKEKK